MVVGHDISTLMMQGSANWDKTGRVPRPNSCRSGKIMDFGSTSTASCRSSEAAFGGGWP